LGGPVRKVDVYDLEQQTQEVVAGRLLGQVLDGESTATDALGGSWLT
jgi:hypothetical protein